MLSAKQRRVGTRIGLGAVLFAATLPVSTAEVTSAHGLEMELPASWRQETPSSSMRAIQASVPGGGQFTVFHFGAGGGGGVEANIARWIGQMELDPGSQPLRQEFERDGLRVHWVSASGTLKASRIGSFPQSDQPGYQLFGAVVEGSGGPWFLRLIGPQAALAEQREAFLGMLSELRAAD